MLKNKKLDHAAFMLLAGYIWILPVAHTTTIREFLFFSLLSVTLWAAWRKEIRLHIPMFNSWIIYTAISIFSLFYAINPIYSLREIWLEIGYSIITILIAAAWVKDEHAFSRTVRLLIIGNIFLVCSALIKGIYILLKSNNAMIATAPFDIGVGKFSSYIILVMPFIWVQALLSLKRNLRIAFLLFLLIIVNIIALYFTANRAAWQALFIQIILIVCLLSYYRVLPSLKKVFLTASLCLLIVTIVLNLITLVQKSGFAIDENNFTAYDILIGKVLKSLSDDPRLNFWQVAFKNIKEQPLSGGGFGREAFKLLNPEYAKTHAYAWHAHNMLLNKGVQMGIPGILAFCLLFVAALRKMWIICTNIKGQNDFIVYAIAGIAMIAGVIIKNFTDDLFIRDHAWLFWLITSAIISALGSQREKPEKL
ncbi:O-antigen ligase family protein [Dissulfurispira sp.]|uniref:O-antigen ligase family protein n=1 Tax=Dissulfurispira sp. TaxID=2817609 RepID=UPI002FD92A8F